MGDPAGPDLDVCPRWTDENLERLATALKDLGARLRVAGSREPVEFPIDAHSLRVFEVSTWRTRGGDLDVVCGLPTRSGSLAGYDDLIEKAVEHSTSIGRVRVASLADIVESKERLARPPDLEALPELRRLLADG